VSRLSAMLERFRRTAGVPTVPAEDFESELAPVFAALEELEADAARVRDRAAAEAAARLTAARVECERIAAAGGPLVEAERVKVASARRAAAEAEARDIVAQAEAEADRIRKRGHERIPSLVDAVLVGVKGTGE
jgi:vacuolar-type H+-ATPase subunit H